MKAETLKNQTVVATAMFLFAIMSLKAAQAEDFMNSKSFYDENQGFSSDLPTKTLLVSNDAPKFKYQKVIPKKGEPRVRPEEAKTLSPYFFVSGEQRDVESLPLKETRAEVKIVGVLAEVKIFQTYKNEGEKPIEAVYIFPASTQAAVHALKMTIGERVIEAKIEERKQAREMYEAAKKEGKTASLLEQQRPNVFQMNVANIMPGDEIIAQLSYTEFLTPVDKIYEFVFPAVVGPRYSNIPEEGAPDTQKWIKNPYLHAGEDVPFKFDIKVDLKPGLPLSELTSPTHDVVAGFTSESSVELGLKEDKNNGNRDFVLQYSLAGGNIAAGTLTYEGETENFFIAMLEPPERVVNSAIVPREYIFVIDVSGSMNGFPLDISKQLMKRIFNKLRPTDYFNILFFSGGSSLLSPQSLPATAENLSNALDIFNNMRGGGGTELLPAIKRALALPRETQVSRIIAVLTDGYVGVEPETFEVIRQNIGKANLFGFGIGSSVNRFIIEGMSRAGMGEPFIVLASDKAPNEAERFAEYISAPLLTGITVEFNGFDAYDIEPLPMPDLFASRPVALFGKYRGKAKGEIIVKGAAADYKFEKRLNLADAQPDKNAEALRYLWARKRIEKLSDMNNLRPNDDRVKEVTELGLKYNLMTAYTSFIAIDSLVRNQSGESETVKQPLPMPEGVSDLAVGGYGKKGSYSSLGISAPLGAAHDSALKKGGYKGGAYGSITLGGEGLGRGGLVEAVEPKAMEMLTYQEEDAEALVKARATITIRIDRGSIRTEGAAGIDRSETQKIIDKNYSALIKTIREAASKDPDLRGNIEIRLQIEKGKLTGVNLANAKGKTKSLEKELYNKLKTVSFASLWKKDGSMDKVKKMVVIVPVIIK